MKKVGIITLYYKNDNYGGIAQSYALNFYIQSLGYDAELITYDRTNNNKNENKLNHSFRKIWVEKDLVIKKLYRKIEKKLVNRLFYKELSESMNSRKKAFEKSRRLIKHSQIYTKNTIKDCVGKYDIYVSGSDQIWKPSVIHPAYVFEFLPENYSRISYASSIAVTNYPQWYGFYMRKVLKNYKWISVREDASKEYLEKLGDLEVDVVVDPTMLLTKKDWEIITSAPQIKEKYVFVYLLGENKYQRKIINNFAKKRDLVIVYLPHIEGHIRACDIGFGNIKLYDVGLSEFLGLIKYSEFVITDSFHAVVFSNIFEKEFFVLERAVLSNKSSMNIRIETLLHMLDEEDRFIKKGKKLLQNYKKIDYECVKNKVNKNIQYSKSKLKNALENCGG